MDGICYVFYCYIIGRKYCERENSGSFLRLKTMPTSITLAMVSKQIAYVAITIIQALVIFSIGKWLFPVMGLPGLDFPHDKASLLLVIVLCGWCAASFAIMIGVFAKTQEQSNGIGAVTIVLFAAIGGLLVPAFAMPQSMQGLMRISPLHWCLEAFYGLFLEGGRLKDIVTILIPTIVMIFPVSANCTLGNEKARAGIEQADNSWQMTGAGVVKKGISITPITSYLRLTVLLIVYHLPSVYCHLYIVH
ncbi:ABC transporter permease [Niabella defluvii]|nr:ABC transporter permease [Niabella sp. I65]